jgi:ribosomal protein S18 acetylase RimI-like enzyme
VSHLKHRAHLHRILETDRIWSAYALADLDPRMDKHCEWLFDENAVILIYKGLTPPLLFFQGGPKELSSLQGRVPPGSFQYSLTGTYKALFEKRLKPSHETRMWRMVLQPDDFPGAQMSDVAGLGPADLPAILALFADHADQPDAFDQAQLNEGPFYGIFDRDELVCLAGIHVLSDWASVAAVGNVFTRPDKRGRGLATRTSAAVVSALLEREIRTIVLNVAMENEPAIRCYRRLGFTPYCVYYEGTGIVSPRSYPG